MGGVDDRVAGVGEGAADSESDFSGAGEFDEGDVEVAGIDGGEKSAIDNFELFGVRGEPGEGEVVAPGVFLVANLEVVFSSGDEFDLA